MKKTEIIDSLNNSNVFNKITNYLRRILKDDVNYDVNVKQNSEIIVISTPLKPGDTGDYYELEIHFNKQRKIQSLVSIYKAYSPQEYSDYYVGIDLYTQAYSYEFDQNEYLIYQSTYIDNNKYYNYNNSGNIKYDVQSLKKYFNDTNPVYEDGFFMCYPNSYHYTYLNMWKRYNEKHFFIKYENNPYSGEHSKIGITFDIEGIDDIDLLLEIKGRFYHNDRLIKIQNIEELIEKLEEIYLSSLKNDFFDLNYFYSRFYDELLEQRDFESR